VLPGFPYTYQVYKDGSTYKADKHLNDGSVTQINQNSDAITVINSVKTDAGLSEPRIHFRNATYDLASSLQFTTGVSGRVHISGENKHGVLFRPTGNFPAIIINNYNMTLENFKIFVDQGSAYTSDGLQLLAQNGQSISNLDMRDLFIEHRDGTGLIQTGNGINIKLAGTGDSAFSWINCDNIRIDGFLNTITNDTQSSAGSASWCNEVSMNRIKATWSKNFFKSNLKAGHVSDGWYWDKCSWQTTAVDATTGDMFDLDDLANRHYQWSFSHCFGWDFANNNHKFLKYKAFTYASLFGCTPDGDSNLGGSGVGLASTNIARAGSQYGPRNGIAKFTADGKTRDFGIVPSLYGSDGGGSADIRNYNINAWAMSIDAIGELAVKEDPTSSTFTVRFKYPPRAANPAGTQNVWIGWEIKAKS
jgi:hypothetical protein